MNPRTRDKAMIQYIKENPNCNKTELTVDMEKKGIASPVVSHKIIKRFQREGKIIVNPDNSNHRIHHLTINNRNEFHLLVAKINEIKRLVKKLNKIVSYRLIFLDVYSLSNEYFELIHLAQLSIYKEITSAANRIENNIKSRDDQEALYLLLTRTLNTSNKLNEMLTPEIYLQVQKFGNKMGDKREKGLVIGHFIKEVSDLFVKR